MIRKRPLSITILCWTLITASVLGLLSKFATGSATSTNSDVSSLSWTLGTLFLVVLPVLSVLILRGNSWARLGLVVLLGIELMRGAVFSWSDSWRTLPIELLVDLLFVGILYQPRGRDFFNGDGELPPILHQIGTVVCYIVTTLALAMLITLPATLELLSGPGDYKYLLAAGIALGAYGIGNMLGVVLNPKRDVGGMLIVAAGLSLLACTFQSLRVAESIEAELRENSADTGGNLWVSGLVTIIVVTLGVILIRQAQHATNQGARPGESHPVTAQN